MFYMGQVLPLPDGRLIVVTATELSFPYFEERGWARLLVGSDEEFRILFKDWTAIKERGDSHPQGRFRRDTNQPDYETLAELVRCSEEGWTEPQVSSSRAPWSWSPPDVCGTLTFAAGTYDEGVVYTVDEAGTVTGDGGATGLTATRFDVVEDKIAAATGEAISYLGPRKELALVEWGAEIRAAVGKIVRYELKDLVGFAPTDANVADFQIKDAAREAREYLQAIGAGRINAYGMLDSSSDGKGSGLMVPILSDERAGF
jgi:hypothetical protein